MIQAMNKKPTANMIVHGREAGSFLRHGARAGCSLSPLTNACKEMSGILLSHTGMKSHS